MDKQAVVPRRRFLQSALATALGGTSLLGYTWLIEPHWIEVVRRDLPIAYLPADLVGKTLIQISDLHVGPQVSDEYLIGALGQVAALEPDILVLTGDYMTCRGGEQVDHVARVLANLRPARLATLGILGNHDYTSGYTVERVADRLVRELRGLGIDMLCNATHNVHGLTIAGLDDLWGPRFHPRPVLARLRADRANLVLCHNPDVADEPVWEGYQGWILAGHTHGGQCKPPFLSPPVVSVINRRYVAGEVDLHDGRRLYINRGLGHLLRVRFNARPEITVFTLQQA